MTFEGASFGVLEDTEPQKPPFQLGKHESDRDTPLTDLEYGHLLHQGLNFVTTPVTNSHFRSRVFKLTSDHLSALKEANERGTTTATSSLGEFILPPLTPEDTGLYPTPAVKTYTAYISPWIDLCSPNPTISKVSRQVLNFEVNYANFCGVRSIVIPGPSQDASKDGGNHGLAQYSRAVCEAMTIGSRLNFFIHMPMYREPVLDSRVSSLASLLPLAVDGPGRVEIDLYSAWDSWNHIRTMCEYSLRLFVALKMPRMMPEKQLQDRWFAEPVLYVTLDAHCFQRNKSGFPSLSKHHQNMIFALMHLKAPPCLMLCDIGPEVSHIKHMSSQSATAPDLHSHEDFPNLNDAVYATDGMKQNRPKGPDAYVDYLRWLESQQEPSSILESPSLIGFQDWLQSPLQPLSDNLESATYEVFEGDPVKYDQYELAMVRALSEWKKLGLPTSGDGAVVVAVAGSGRGPLVTRALKAAEQTGVVVDVWALEKNPNAYVYLLQQNKTAWAGRVKVIKTDMRAWKGPDISGLMGVYDKVDILVSELLGSFGDNELSPECLDGIQHVLAKPYGISIPSSYTAHLSPISTPKIHAELVARAPSEPTAFETPWVVRLFALDFVSERVPLHPRFQQAWEFSHPIPDSTLANVEAMRSGGVMGGVGGSMAGAAGANDHNSRHCHLTFVCRTPGVTHGLAGYFESTLYEPRSEDDGGEKVEISTHPERIDAKSKDMISWFPIFFSLKHPLQYPADTELEVSMWRQTDDSKVWYEWMVEAWSWVGPTRRIKVGSSELCSSRRMACLM